MICSIEGCGRPVVGRGYCGPHYKKLRKYGDPLADNRRRRGTCTVDDCAEPAVARGLCGTHYKRWHRTGGTEADDLRYGNKMPHPAYWAWCWIRKQTVVPYPQEWEEFRKFADDVGERPSDRHKLVRVDRGRSYSADNVRWVEYKTDVPETEDRRAYQREYMRQYRKHDPAYFKDRDLRRRFGIGLAEYLETLLAQKGVCAICGEAETADVGSRKMILAVDHCHGSKKIRGLLCKNCNTGLGAFKDDPGRLRAAIRYLRKHGS